jgi:hypothetical protein
VVLLRGRGVGGELAQFRTDVEDRLSNRVRLSARDQRVAAGNDLPGDARRVLTEMTLEVPPERVERVDIHQEEARRHPRRNRGRRTVVCEYDRCVCVFNQRGKVGTTLNDMPIAGANRHLQHDHRSERHQRSTDDSSKGGHLP